MELGFSAGGVEFTVFEEAAFFGEFWFSAGPLDAAVTIEVGVVGDAGDIAGLSGGEFFENLEGGFRGGPFFKHFSDTPSVSEELKNAEIAEGFSGCGAELLDGRDTALRVDEAAVFFSPRGSREQEISGFGGLGAGIHILHDEEFEFFSDFLKAILVDPRMSGVGGDDPEAFYFARFDAVDDLIVGPRGFGRDIFFGDFEDAGDFFAVRGVGEIMSTEEVGGV